jgi:hypothetical protein
MSAREKIGRLEELLARVQARANAPRAVADGAPSTTPHPATPPMAAFASAPPALAPDDSDVEVSSEVVEVDIDVDVDEMVGMESGAQLAADHASMPPDELEEVHSVAPPANELEEPAPASSPRPIVEAEAYAEESAPRHTPPPESGKQVAAPSVQPAARKSSVPPDSLVEGHTLIGGWREPGLPGGPPLPGGPGGPGVPAVRVPAPAAAPPAAAPPAQTSGTRLSPDVTRPSLPAESRVAAFEGGAPAFKPATFGELLDATLAL